MALGAGKKMGGYRQAAVCDLSPSPPLSCLLKYSIQSQLPSSHPSRDKEEEQMSLPLQPAVLEGT